MNQQINIVNAGYRSTNYWVVSTDRSRIMVDIGWPGTMKEMLATLARVDVPIEELRYVFATHYHIDHAGLGEEFKRLGVRLLVVDHQVEFIASMAQWTKPQDRYIPITNEGNTIITCSESRTLLEEIRIPGELVPTPGHTDHCVSLLLDNGAVFTGDLPHPAMIVDNSTAQRTWATLRDRGATRVYPAHGPVWDLDAP